VTYHAVLIGCGKIGSVFADDPLVEGVHSHAGAYSACPSTELVAVCDADPVRLDDCARRWGVAARYGDARALLSEQRPDIVSVCTPDHTHFDLIRLAIETPGVLGVLAEKPLALECAQAEELVTLAKARGVALAVNYSRRYAPGYVELREWIRSGGIGEIQSVGGIYTKGTVHNGTHWFDLARFLVGEIVEVWGFDVRGEGGADPTLDAFLRFESGAGAHLHGCDASAYTLFEMDLIATRGRVRVLESGHVMESHRVVDSPRYTGYRTLALDRRADAGFKDVLLHAVKDLVCAVSQGTPPACSGRDGVAALKVAFAVRESARTGQPVRLGMARFD
jgi:predicted dehydrogenase